MAAVAPVSVAPLAPVGSTASASSAVSAVTSAAAASTAAQPSGIPFFKDPETCIASYSKTGNIPFAKHTLQRMGNALYYIGTRALQSCRKDVVGNFASVPEKGFLKHKLVVFLHGRGSSPTQFTWIINEVLKAGGNADIYAPNILDKGKTELDKAAAPILAEIEKWAKLHHDQKLELVLVGSSNGGRIARALDAKLDGLKNITKFRLVSLVGACKGSSLANVTNFLKIGQILDLLKIGHLVGNDVRIELPVNSAKNQQLDKDWESSLKATPFRERQYTFIATPLDLLVPNYSSTLCKVPDPNAKVEYAIAPSFGHLSIVLGVAKTVASIIVK